MANYTVGITETFEQVTFNLPPDPLTPNGATLLFSPDQARALAALLLKAADAADWELEGKTLYAD